MRWLPLILTVLGAAAWGWHQRLEHHRLAEQLRRVRSQIESAPATQGRSASASGEAEAALNQLETIRANHRELLRLRGEIGALREKGQLTPDNLEAKIRNTRAETEATERETELLKARQLA